MKNTASFILAILFFILSKGLIAQSKQLPNLKIQKLDLTWVNTKNICDSNEITIVSFWATWCKYCILELNAVNKIYPSLQKKYNVKMYAVSIDGLDDLEKVKNKSFQSGWQYEILLDNDMLLAESLSMDNPPSTYILNREGQVLWEHVGFSPGDEIILQQKVWEFYSKTK
jgi:cytochrome c biogenesis protein CcmG/thiol:disulfide interchange protein DsbE